MTSKGVLCGTAACRARGKRKSHREELESAAGKANDNHSEEHTVAEFIEFCVPPLALKHISTLMPESVSTLVLRDASRATHHNVCVTISQGPLKAASTGKPADALQYGAMRLKTI